MQAIRVHPNVDQSNHFSVTNPAPPSALVLDSDLPIPQPLNLGELLIRIEATTVVRDSLTWPETYLEHYSVLGNDFAGTVVAVNGASDESRFKPGDEVYGMADPSRAGTWAEYAIVTSEEACLKPKHVTWAQAAAVPLSALTAYQALFEKAGLPPPNFSKQQVASKPHHAEDTLNRASILITGASGCVGLYLVQLAKLAGLHVVAATRSNTRNKDLLEKIGADEIVEYHELVEKPNRFQVIIDTIGGIVLKSCWSLVQETGTIVSIDSASHNFVEEHEKLGLNRGMEVVKALFFIVSPSRENLERLSLALDSKLLQPFVAGIMPLADARLAYEYSSSVPTRPGKMVLITQSKLGLMAQV